MSKEKLRTTTKQPGVYFNQKTGKYDVKYYYTEYDPIDNQKRYKTKWVYGIDSYKLALDTLVKMKSGNTNVKDDGVTLKDALELWMTKADEALYKTNEIIKNLNDELDVLKSRKKNIRIAVSVINKSLRYVFFQKIG